MKPNENETIHMLKRDYESIHVPEEARERVLKGIAQAKNEQKGKNIMIFTKRTGMGAAAAIATITILTNINPAIANAMEQIPVIGSIAKVVTFRTYEDKNNNNEADIQVPGVTINGEDGSQIPANKSIEEYADELIAMYEKEVTQSNGEGHYSLESTYKVATDTDKYLSIRIDTTQVMASGAQFVKIFTIDKSTGNIVTLADLSGNRPEMLGLISDNIKEQMVEQMAADPGIMYFYNSEIPEEDFKGLTGDESYYFNKDGELVIAFDEYQVAPGYMGAVEFTIPSSITGTF